MSIDPAVLRARAAEAAGRLADPAAAAAMIRRLRADYADRAHRPSPGAADNPGAPLHKTPAPVLRAVVTALRGPAQSTPDSVLALARALWAGGAREERGLAAELLALATAGAPAAALEQVEAWIVEIDSAETAEALARHGLGPALAADPYRVLEQARRWAASPARWVRRLGVGVVASLARERRWDDVPAALAVLRPLMGERDPAVRQALGAALAALAARRPPAVAHFLAEFAPRQDHHTQMIVRAALRGLPAEAQAEVVRALRT